MTEPAQLPPWLLRVAGAPDWDHAWAVPRKWAALLAAARAEDALWRDHHEQIAAAWVEFTQSVYPQMLADLGAVPWDRLSSEQLLVLWQQGMIAEAALRDLRMPDDSPVETVCRFYALLVTCGVWLHVNGHAATPLDYAVNVAAGHTPRRYVLEEISGRGADHRPGFAAAVVRVAAAVRTQTGGRADIEAEIAAVEDLEIAAIEELAQRARSRLPLAVKAKIDESVPMLELRGQVPFTIDKIATGKRGKRLGLDDPLRMLSAALSGRLNFASRAIRWAVLSEERHQRVDFFDRAEQHEVKAGDSKQDDENQLEVTILEYRRRSAEQAPLLIDGDEMVQRFLAAHPEHEQGVQFALATAPGDATVVMTGDDLASLHGIIRQTVINRRNRAREAFRAWCASQNV